MLCYIHKLCLYEHALQTYAWWATQEISHQLYVATAKLTSSTKNSGTESSVASDCRMTGGRRRLRSCMPWLSRTTRKICMTCFANLVIVPPKEASNRYSHWMAVPSQRRIRSDIYSVSVCSLSSYILNTESVVSTHAQQRSVDKGLASPPTHDEIKDSPY